MSNATGLLTLTRDDWQFTVTCLVVNSSACLHAAQQSARTTGTGGMHGNVSHDD